MFLEILPFYYALLCFFLGRSVGKIIDIQYRESEGKPRLRCLSKKARIFFAFSDHNMVVAEGIVAHILGYIFTLLELIAVALFTATEMNIFLALSQWLFYAFVFILVILVMFPMAVRYEHNIQIAYDCDWITNRMRSFSMLPKRRCKVVNQLDDSTYEITLGYCGRKKRKAKTSVPVSTGDFVYAVNYFDDGPPFWTIRLH